ncbi:MAG: hypothetical protein LBT05_08140 [Planctomycetaceae bacterium]|nr:hypothetical protein [Planctomycetaceae bacterium]
MVILDNCSCIKSARRNVPRLHKILADDEYSGEKMRKFVKKNYGWEFETVKRTDLANGKIQHQRWKVERTIIGRND